MKIAVLFDGAGLARLGLEQAGHDCTGFEFDPLTHELSKYVGSGKSILCDATKVDLSQFDAVWASPPCQRHSVANTSGYTVGNYATDHLAWSLGLDFEILWVENVFVPSDHDWGVSWNAAQFLQRPLQSRNRVIGGRYQFPPVYHPYKKVFPNICPTITATEYRGSANDKRRASRFYGRRLTIDECAYHQGFEIPYQWRLIATEQRIYQAIGNGVPVYMSKAFGDVYK